MRKFVATAITAGAALGVVLAPVAASAATAHVAVLASGGTSTTIKPEALPQSGNTALTFQVTSGELSISVPASADLGPGSTTPTGDANPIVGSLGTVTVTDNRAALAANWTTSASETDFTSGAHTIPATDASYTPGDFTVTATNNPGPAAASTPPIGLSNAATPVVTTSTVDGSSIVSWDPTITITLPDDAPVGNYAGTLTHSVA
jgi:hypothetical protein